MAMCVTSRVAVRLISWAIASAVIGEAQVSFESFIVSILVTWHGEGNGEGSAPRGEKAACTATLPPQPGGCVGVGAGIGCRRREGGFSPCAPMLHAPCSMLHAPCSHDGRRWHAHGRRWYLFAYGPSTTRPYGLRRFRAMWV
jgi:hypothetical protein